MQLTRQSKAFAVGCSSSARQPTSVRPQRLLRSASRNAPALRQLTVRADNGSSDMNYRDFEQDYLQQRAQVVNESFPGALGVDDFIHRLEIGLFSYGFSGENAIACTNLCRDEITCTLRNKIDHAFGNSFNVNGLGGVLTTGVLGIGAGLSHSPVDSESGKERYVFFSFPHIAISPYHEPGVLCRPGRPGKSGACGALIKALSDLKEEGLDANCKTPGVHVPENPEYSILKQRLARLIRNDGKTEQDVQNMSLVDLTKAAERTITNDLEFLISQAVDPKKADYAVVAGVQIHSWGKAWGDDTPNLEYVQPCVVYTVVNGEKTALDLNKIPALTPRQIKELAAARGELNEMPGDDGQTLRSDYYTPLGTTIEKSNKFKNLLGGLKELVN